MKPTIVEKSDLFLAWKHIRFKSSKARQLQWLTEIIQPCYKTVLVSVEPVKEYYKITFTLDLGGTFSLLAEHVYIFCKLLEK